MLNRVFPFLILVCLIYGLTPSYSWSAAPEFRLSKGQTLYVPAYSHVFSGPRRLPFALATTLSIRNTDLSASLRVSSIDYYDSNGKMLRRFLPKPVPIGPLGSTYVHLEEKDTAGGFGANFVVRWEADRLVNAPIVECVMIGATSGQGISFVSAAQEIKE
jgi:hypothetical protein